jgi:MYXO-CTERM domain-containing protein
VKDLVVTKSAPHTVFAITSTFGPAAGADGGAGYTQQIFTSTDDGGHWSAIGTIDPSAIVTTLDVAPSDPQRFYVSAFRGDGSARTASLFVSTNGGGAWTEYPTPFDAAHESATYIAAVDPTNADRVYVRSEGASRLLVTVDGGKTFQVPLSLNDEMAGFALSQDGSTVYAGGPNVGLYSAAAADLKFTPVLQQLPDGGTHAIHVQCLAMHGADLWACSDEPSGFVAGVSQDGGKTFTAKLHLTTILGPLSCPASTPGAACNATDFDANPPYNPFGSLCTNLGVCFDGGATYPLSEACVEAGACSTYFSSSSGGGSGGSGSGSGSGGNPGDGGGSSGGGGSGGGSKSCGCTQVGGGGAAVGGLAAAALVLVALRRRRARP